MNETNNTNNTKPGFFKRLFIFGSTPKVALNCLGMMLATLLVLWLVFGGLLKCYTQHNKTFEIPNFIDMNIEDLKDEAAKSRFTFDYTETPYNRRIPKGIIIRQNPEPGTRAKNGRTIYITYNPTKRSKNKVPDKIYGQQLRIAQSKLRIAEFEVNIKKKVIDPDAPGTIKEVSYKGKIIEDRKGYKELEVFVGDTIDLVVAEDYNGGSTQVPNLVCLTYAEALFALRNGHNLMLGDVTLDATVRDSSSAYVVGQFPFYAPGEFINVGSQVDLRLSQRQPADCGEEGDTGDFTPGDGNGSGFQSPVNDSDAVVPDDDLDDDLGF